MTADELSKILDELGRRLGPAGQHLFDLAVRQVFINSILWIVVAVVIGGLSAWTFRRADIADHFDAPVIRLIGGVGLVFATLIAAFALSYLLNPEYSAIRDLVGTVR